MSSEKKNCKEVHFSYMTTTLHEGIYELFKIKYWSTLLMKNEKPVKWLKPTENGTRVLVSPINSIVDLIIARKELRKYIEFVNNRYGFNLMLQWGYSSESIKCVPNRKG